MPFVRCRFYSESGEPIRTGCHRKGAGCAFVHPDDPDWNNAPPSTFKPRDKRGDSGSFRPWGGGRGAAAPSAWDTSGTTGTNTADTGSGWGAESGQGTASGWDAVGEWGAEGAWGGGTGWDKGGSTATPSQVTEPTQSHNPSTTSAPMGERNQADSSASGNSKLSGHGWGRPADKATGSGWGSTGNDSWGASGWGTTQDSDKAADAGSGWGSTGNDGWGASGWGDAKDADNGGGSGWESTQNGAWGSGWGGNKDTTNSHAAPEPMMVDNPDPAEKEPERNKGKGRVVPAPPRIRIPDNGSKKPRMTGTNNEPLSSNKWGEPRSSNVVSTSTPVTTSTPITMITPTDSSRPKRKRDTASEDNLDIFREYVKTWERGVRARFLLAEAEDKRHRWFRTQKSACYARIGEAGRKRLDDRRTECDQEVKLQWDKLSSAVTSLVQFHDTMSSSLDLGQRYKIGEEAEKFMTESKAFVDEIRALLVAHVLKDKNDVESGDTQRRLSGADATSVDSLQKRLRDLEERFDQAQTELTLRHQRDIRSDIDDLLVAKIAELRVARQCEVDRVASQPHPEIVIPPSALENMEATAKQVGEVDAKVPHTVEDIRVLLLRVDATTKRVNELEEELSVNKATYGKQVQEMAAEKEKTERRIDERLEKIQEQFELLVASQPTGPGAGPAMSPAIDISRDKLMESIRPAFEAVLDKFYEQEVQPTIGSLQRVVIEASNRHQEEAMKVLWGKIQPAMNMVAGVSRWLDSQELALTAPVEADHTSIVTT